MASSWLAYNEPAWTEDLLADPSDYEGEAGGYVDLIKGKALHAPGTLLHLGCALAGSSMSWRFQTDSQCLA